MAHPSLFIRIVATTPTRFRRCTYVVTIDRTDEDLESLRDLAAYLAELSLIACEVVVLDASDSETFAENGRVLRWVSRQIAMPRGGDAARAAAEVARCEKVIVAEAHTRCTPDDISRFCGLLDTHEVVEPHDYVEPLPWWGSIEAGRVLVHRAVEPVEGQASVFAMRRGTVRSLPRGTNDRLAHPVKRLLHAGAQVQQVNDFFVRSEPQSLGNWLRSRGRSAEADLAVPARSAFFFALLPLTFIIGVAGGLELAGAYLASLACGVLVLALRGRRGASPYFPLRACLSAPAWLVERSLSVYCALYRRLRRGVGEPVRSAAAPAGNAKAASGE